MAQLGVTYRLDPTPQQAVQMAGFAAACRVVWNAALEQRETAWRRQRERVGFATQCRDIKDARAAFPFIAKAPFNALTQTLRDLDRAYGNWWAGRARAPSWKSAKRNAPAFRVQGADTRVLPGDRHVRLAKIGAIRAHISREMPGRVLSATFARRGEHWHVSYCCEVPDPSPPPHTGEPVGLDLGVANTVTLSTGEHLHMPVPTAHDWTVLARLQRRLARRTGRRGRRGTQRDARRGVATDC